MAEEQGNAKTDRGSEMMQIRQTKKDEPGLKYDYGKAPMSLLPAKALEVEAQVLAYGAEKYAAHNWRKGMSHSRLLDAALRHCMAIANGEWIDPESGLPHVGHARCMLGFLADLHETKPEFDDLYKVEKADGEDIPSV